MKKGLMILLGTVLVVGTSSYVMAGEHGGKEHGGQAKGSGGQEHGGKEANVKKMKAMVMETPSNEDIRNAMAAYVKAESEATGTFNVVDPDTGKTLNLELLKVHERVGKTGNYYYSCADFKDVNTKELYDLDLDVAGHGKNLMVADVRVHKVAGEPRYTYDDKDNRIPLKDTKSHLGLKGMMKGSAMEHKGSGKEHGGNEHGGQEHGGQEHGGQEHGGQEHGGN